MSIKLIRPARQKAQLTQTQLAHLIGCDQASISRYESERGKPEPNVALQLALTLNLDQFELLRIIYPDQELPKARKRAS